MRIRRFLAVGTVFLASCLVCSAQADVVVSGLFSDHMVLQRDVPLPVWGTARANERVTVTIGGREVSTNADAAGNWRVKLEPLAAGGPLEMSIAGDNTVTVRDVLVGEVWVCSGQSNMALQVGRALNPEQEIAAADYPQIRLLTVSRMVADEPSAFAGKEWRVCSPATVGEFSAVGYFFGRELHKALKVPVGLIDSAVGGTPAESWTPRPVLEADPAFQPIFERWKNRLAASKAAERKRAGESATVGGNAVRTNRAAARPRPTSRPGRAASRPAQGAADLVKSAQRPSVLYNGMIHPLVPYAIRGAIWYQGEANAKRAYQYRKLFPTMIRSWRQAWGQGDFPFLFVQLASWKAGQTEPYQSTWAELREAQLMTLTVPQTAMAVTTDIGDPQDIHPRNKQEVGRRLALAARAVAYGESIPHSGPLYDSMSVEGDRIRLRFKHANGGLKARDGASLKGFAVAGEDQKFVEAEAVIDGETVLVRSDKIGRPVAVRYAWADVPEDNLVNGAGLPASPFRTDDWPGVTVDEQ